MMGRNHVVLLVAFWLSFIEAKSWRGNLDQVNRFNMDQCGYESCDLGNPNLINIHLIPHTHDDVGWLKTVDQYYYGSKNSIQNAGVQYILDTVIEELQKDPKKRFIYVEIAFFYRWWNEQHDMTRHVVKQLVREGRLEFILGGWCMNDEAATHYNAIIDQHTIGFKFLRDNFGDCGRPRVAWQIDPFGHSKEQASLFAQMGFDGLFFARIDYQDKNLRIKNKTLEMMWKGSNNLGDVTNLFTGAFFADYSSPAAFCFDAHCNDEPIMDDDRLHDYNVKDRVDAFIKLMNDRVAAFKTNHILQTMGGDFNFMNAHLYFKNLDKLIKYVNARQSNGSKINLLYSTPSCYVYALNKANITWPTKSDDFFPYASDPHSYWTGYFTSRPSLKQYVRVTNNFLQVCKQLDALARLGIEQSSDVKLNVLRRAMGVAQHHDAVSGTEKQPVAYDYALRLANGTTECQGVVKDAMQKLMSKGGATPPDQVFCNLINISACNFTEKYTDQFVMTLYNPIGREVTWWARIPLVYNSYEVTGPDGRQVPVQIVPISSRTKGIPERGASKSKYELVMNVTLPALGFNNYFFRKIQGNAVPRLSRSQIIRNRVLSQKSNLTLENQHVKVTFDPSTGMINSMTNKDKQITIPLEQALMYYSSFQGNNSDSKFRSSGAYIFRPVEKSPKPLGVKASMAAVQGGLVNEMHQLFTPWASQVVRVYDNERFVELEWTAGPIPIDDKQGKEVISYFKTGIASNRTFYTDANGREMQRRVRDFRPTWPLQVNESVAGNYYPVNSRIALRDETHGTKQFTVMTDRSLGGGSIVDGDLEIMIHRRCLHDDAFGVGAALNESGADGKGLIVRGKMYILLDSVEDSGKLHRDLGERLFMAPSVSFMDSSLSYSSWESKYKVTYSGLKRALPSNVHLLTLEQFHANAFLLRLEHFYEKNEDRTLSQPVTVSLKGLFEPFEIQAIEELTLGANQRTADAKRLKWNYKDAEESSQRSVHESDSIRTNEVFEDVFDIELQPMQIRTFQVEIAE